MKKTLIAVTLLAFCGTGHAGKNPETEASDRNFETNQPNSIPGGLQKAEDGGNRALNTVDEGVHKGASKAKKGAKKAGEATKETYDKAMAPAIEPDPARDTN